MQRKPRHRSSRYAPKRLLTAAAVAGLAATASFAVAPPAGAAGTPKLTVKNGIVADGGSVAADLTGFTPGDVIVSYCAVTVVQFAPVSGPCAPNPVTATADASGDAAVQVTAVKRFTGTDEKATPVDCTTSMCALSASYPSGDKTKYAVGYVAFDTPKLTRTPGGNLNPHAAESTVTITASGYRGNGSMRLTQCSSAKAEDCITTLGKGYEEPAVGPDGTFTQKITVYPTYTIKDKTIDCTTEGAACVVMTSNKDAGGDRTQEASVALTWGPSLAASKTTGIALAGETVTVTGTGYGIGTDEHGDFGLYLALCDTASSSGGLCDMANFKQVTPDGNGNFTQAMTVVGTFKAGAKSIDCTVSVCALQTSRVALGSDLSQIATLPLSFAAGTGGGTGGGSTDGDQPTGSLSKTTHAPGEGGEVNASGFAPNETVTLTLHSDPVSLGTTQADSTGTVYTTYTIPVGTPAGAHTLVLFGTTSGKSLSLSLTVTAEAAAPLAATGPGGLTVLLPVAVLALLAGSGVLLLARRRSTAG